MKVVALVSGGKDSCYNMLQCVKYGHQIVALANLKPPSSSNNPYLSSSEDELDSFMYQTVGHQAIDAYAEAMDLPLYRADITGKAVLQTLHYNETEVDKSQNTKEQSIDEVEELYTLLSRVKDLHPEIEAVSSGAILSNYQRNRVENVCARLGLISLAFLWQKDQKELLKEMIDNSIEAVLIKVAAIGLNQTHLGKSLSQLYPYLCKLNQEYESNICGEGGEYESFTLDCPLFKKKIVIDEVETIMHGEDAFAPVAYLNINKYHLELKDKELTQIIPHQVPPNVTTINQNPIIKNSTSLLPKPQFTNYKVNNNMYYISGDIATYQISNDLSISEQFHSIMKNIEEDLSKHNMSLKNAYFIYVYLSDMTNFTIMNNAYKQYFGTNPPSRACVAVPLPFGKVQVECYGQAEQNKQVLHVQSISEWAPACIGPYSQCNIINDLLYQAGQIALYPPTMTITSNDISVQLELVLHNIQQVISALRSDFKFTIYCTVYVTDITNIDAIIRHCHNTINNPKICFKWVQVSQLPRNALIELQMISYTNNSDTQQSLQHFRDEKSADDIIFKSNCVFTEEDFLFTQTTVNTTESTPLNKVITNLIDHLFSIINRAEFKVESLLFVKILYNVNSVTSESIINALNSVDTKTFAVSIIPFQNLQDNSLLIVETSSYNKRQN